MFIIIGRVFGYLSTELSIAFMINRNYKNNINGVSNLMDGLFCGVGASLAECAICGDV